MNRQTFARKCSITGVGMNEGYCFGDGIAYAATRKAAIQIAKEWGYKSLNQAYEDEAYYWTEWDDDDHQYEVVDGELVELEVTDDEC